MFPRGNWKTSTSALIGLHHLLWVEHASVALAAGSREQARIAGAILSTHARAFPALVLRHDEVRAPSGLLRVIAADGGRAHGRTDTLMIGDQRRPSAGASMNAPERLTSPASARARMRPSGESS